MMNRQTRRGAEAKQRKLLERNMRRFAAHNQELLAFHESLTSPDKEDWLVIVDGEQLFLQRLTEDHEGVHCAWTEITISGLRTGGPYGSIETAKNICEAIGCVTIILPTDADARGAVEFLNWMNTVAKKQGFSVVSIVGTVPTSKCIEVWKKNQLYLAESMGEA